jgi:putative ABC transport system permease protein
MRMQHWFYKLPLRIRSLFRAGSADQDLNDEMQYHMDRLVQEHMAKGLPEESARLAAVRAMDGLEQNKEKCRDARSVSVPLNLARDIRYAVRGLRKSPGFCIVAVLTLALGIGANTAMFSVVNAILLRPLPFPEPSHLVHLWEAPPDNPAKRNVVNPWNFLIWREHTHSFAGMAAVSTGELNLTGEGNPVALPSASVSADYFSVLGIPALIGRTFQPADDTPGHDDKAVLSYGLWQQRFGGDPQIIGKSLSIDGRPVVVIGVMPQSFVVPGSTARIWTPMAITRDPGWGKGRYATVIARLKPGVTLAQAQQDMAAVARIEAELRPDYDRNWGALCFPMLQDVTGDLRLPLLVLLGAVGFLLLITCANVANLVLMRGAGRLREIALREALGATRRRIVQQLLTEGIVLALSGMAAGLLLTVLAVPSMVAMIPQSLALPRSESISVDGRVLLFALVISALTAILFGLAPSLRASRVRLHHVLRQSGQQIGATGNRRLRNAFVVMELALAILLCMGAGLLLRSFQRLISVDPGFQTANTVTMRIFTSPAKYQKASQRAEYVENILSEVRAVPGVEAAGSVHFLPLRGQVSRSCFGPPTREEPNPTRSPDAQFLIVSEGYFAAMQTPVIAGRDFDSRDAMGKASVMIVNQAFVRQYLAGHNPVGERFSVCWNVTNPAEIVGVVADTRQKALDDSPQPTIYLPNSQVAMYFASLVVRAKGNPRQITDSVISAIHRVDSEQPVAAVETLDSVLNSSVSRPRFAMILLIIFAGLALTLSAIGVYGVISYSVQQRSQEIGIRLALGAQGSSLVKLVLKEALSLALFGLIAGAVCLLFLTRVLSSLLFEVRPYDPLTLLGASMVLLTTAALAAFVPAFRATRVDPMLALRSE